jgi:hypothetical protein
LTAKGAICSTMTAGSCVHIVNAKAEMYKGSMRLQVFEGEAEVEDISESISVRVRLHPARLMPSSVPEQQQDHLRTWCTRVCTARCHQRTMVIPISRHACA